MGLSPEKLAIVKVEATKLVEKLPNDLTSSQRATIVDLLSDTFMVAYNMGTEHHLETTQRIIQATIDKEADTIKRIVHKYDSY